MLFINLSINKIKNNMWGNYKSYLAYQSKGDEKIDEKSWESRTDKN